MTSPPISRVSADPATDARRPAALFSRVVMEVVYGRRSIHQVSRWTTNECFTRLEHRVALAESLTGSAVARRSIGDIAVRRVRVDPVGADAVEAAAVVATQARVHAVAMRLETANARWLITALEIG